MCVSVCVCCRVLKQTHVNAPSLLVFRRHFTLGSLVRSRQSLSEKQKSVVMKTVVMKSMMTTAGFKTSREGQESKAKIRADSCAEAEAGAAAWEEMELVSVSTSPVVPQSHRLCSFVPSV